MPQDVWRRFPPAHAAANLTVSLAKTPIAETREECRASLYALSSDIIEIAGTKQPRAISQSEPVL